MSFPQSSQRLRAALLAMLAIASWTTGAVESAMVGNAVSRGVGVEMVAAVVAPAPAAAPAAAKPATAAAPTGADAAMSLNAVFEIIFALFQPATMLAGWLLSPDWTFGEIFGLRPILHQLWVLVSNIVYVVFAFLLVGVAFMNIFGAGGDHYAIKKALPRFVVGILIVPFSWFAVSAILSIANILTVSVLRLPGDMLDKNASSEMMVNLPKWVKLNFDKVSQWTGAKDGKAQAGKIFSSSTDTNKKDIVEVPLKDILTADKGAYGILNLYAYDVFRVQDFKKITWNNIKSFAGIIDIGIQLGIWVIFLFVFILLIFALTFALFTRAVYLWLIAVFSPLFGLFYFLEGSKGKFVEEFGKKFSFGAFVSLAMVPVYASAALGFGFMFLKLTANAEIKPENSSFFSEAETKGGTTTLRVGGKDKGMDVIVVGMPL